VTVVEFPQGVYRGELTAVDLADSKRGICYFTFTIDLVNPNDPNVKQLDAFMVRMQDYAALEKRARDMYQQATDEVSYTPLPKRRQAQWKQERNRYRK